MIALSGWAIGQAAGAEVSWEYFVARSMIPEDRYYTMSHVWVKLDEAKVVIGAAEPLVRSLGPLLAVELPDPGEEMMLDVPFGEIESVHTVHQLYPPADAVVLETNESVLYDVDRLTRDPYGEGWLLKIRVHDPEQIKDLVASEAYADFCKEYFGGTADR